jgi:hypothetical protein
MNCPNLMAIVPGEEDETGVLVETLGNDEELDWPLILQLMC